MLPVVVVTELEGKRHHPELGYFARTALRMLDELRIKEGGSTHRSPSGKTAARCRSSSTTRTPARCRPASARRQRHRILSVAKNLSNEGHDVTIVSKDLPMRVKASAVGLAAEEYRAELAVDSGWTGMTELDVTVEEMDALYEHGRVEHASCRAAVPHRAGAALAAGSGLGRVGADKQIRLVRGDRDAFGLHGRSAEQRIALDLLLDPDVGIVSLGGRAGTGKSALALCAGLEAVMERRQQRKVVVFRPLYAVGGQELGYLPGASPRRWGPGAGGLRHPRRLVSHEVVEEVMDRGMLEVLPLTHIRGRSLHDAFVIVDEAQSLERNVLLTVLSRIGQNSKVVLTHDVAQRDNLRVGRHDGVAAVIEALKGHPLFAHVTLTRSEAHRCSGHRPARGARIAATQPGPGARASRSQGAGALRCAAGAGQAVGAGEGRGRSAQGSGRSAQRGAPCSAVGAAACCETRHDRTQKGGMCPVSRPMNALTSRFGNAPPGVIGWRPRGPRLHDTPPCPWK